MTVLLLLSSCEAEVTFIGKETPSHLVMYSLASTTEPLRADLSQSLFFLTPETGADGTSELFFRDLLSCRRTVTCSVNGEPAVEMTEEFTPVAGPVPQREVEPGLLSVGRDWDESCFHYVSTYVPREGDHIRLDARVEGFGEVSAETTVPVSPQFEVLSASVAVDPEYSSVEIRLTLRIRGESLSDNCYYLMPVLVDSLGDAWDLYYMSGDIIFRQNDVIGAVEDAIVEESTVDPLFRGSILSGGEHTFSITIPAWATGLYGHVEPGIRLYIQLSSLTYDYFNYLTTVDAGDHGIIARMTEPVQLFCNISGGIGCFCSSSTKVLEVPLPFQD